MIFFCPDQFGLVLYKTDCSYGLLYQKKMKKKLFFFVADIYESTRLGEPAIRGSDFSQIFLLGFGRLQ